jgi:hypothetical protein
MNIAICKNNNEVEQKIVNEIPVIIIKNFEKEEVCNQMRCSAHLFSKQNSPKLGCRFQETFWQIDVLPSKVLTDRIFRTWCIFPSDDLPIVNSTASVFKKMELFQKKYLGVESFINDTVQRRPQIIHYPVGGGFFDWHSHSRLPTNYGLILNLSKKGRDFNVGQTEIKAENGEVIKVEDYADIGDLILFRYDLPHRVAPCDSDQDLMFSENGRWTAVLPLIDSTRADLA